MQKLIFKDLNEQFKGNHDLMKAFLDGYNFGYKQAAEEHTKILDKVFKKEMKIVKEGLDKVFKKEMKIVKEGSALSK